MQSLLKSFITRSQPSQRWYEVVSSLIDQFGAVSDTHATAPFLKGLFSRLVTIVLHSARGCDVSLARLPQALLPPVDEFLGTGETGKKRKRSEWTDARCASFAALARVLNEVSTLREDAASDLRGLLAMTANLRYAQSEEAVFEGVSRILVSRLTSRSLYFVGRARSTRTPT